jgi:hypothetical protein
MFAFGDMKTYGGYQKKLLKEAKKQGVIKK